MREFFIIIVIALNLLTFKDEVLAGTAAIYPSEISPNDGVDQKELIDKSLIENFNEDFSKDIEDINDMLTELSDCSHISFEEMTNAFMAGRFAVVGKLGLEYIGECFTEEVMKNKGVILQLILLSVIFSIVHNFADVFRDSQISEMSFMVVFMIMALLAFKSYSVTGELVEKSCENIRHLVEIMMPVIAGSMVFSGNISTASGYGAVTIFGIYLVETFLQKIVLPCINCFLTVRMLGGLTRDGKLNGMSALLLQGANWIMRASGVVVLGMSVIRNMITPSMDRLKYLESRKVVSLIPGIGNSIDTAGQLIISSGDVIKNAVGTTAVVMIIFVSMVPVMKVAVVCIMYRFGAALIEPVTDNRLCYLIQGVSEASDMLLKMLFTISGMFIGVIAVAIISGNMSG